MLSQRPLDERVPIQQQLGAEASPAILINVFTVAPEDVDGLLAAWEHDANWMKKQPGYISTQLHRGIAGSCMFLNYAVSGNRSSISARLSPIPSFAPRWRPIRQASSPHRICSPRSRCRLPPNAQRRHCRHCRHSRWLLRHRPSQNPTPSRCRRCSHRSASTSRCAPRRRRWRRSCSRRCRPPHRRAS